MSLAWVDLDRGVLAIGGAERLGFLQSLVSADVTPLESGEAVWTALLTPQGKYLFDFFLYPDGERLLLDVEAPRTSELMRRLMLYRLRAKVTIEDLSATFQVAALLGSPAAPDRVAGGVLAADPRDPALGWRLVLPTALVPAARAELDAVPAPFARWDRQRIALGIPDGSRDLVLEKTTLMEAGFERLHGVSFAKGCYVGQELTARMKYRGLAKRGLVVLQAAGDAPAPGTPVLADGQELGELRSVSGDLALASLRLGHDPKATLTAAGIALQQVNGLQS